MYINSFDLYINPKQYNHLTDENTEVQRGHVTFPRPTAGITRVFNKS